MRGPSKTNILAHRASWELQHGPIPQGQYVLHRCDVPSCVNPDHLFLGAQDANMADCAKKNRTAAGEGHGRAKFSDAQIDDVRWLRGLGLSCEAVAFTTGISLSHVYAVLSGHKRAKPNGHSQGR